MNCVKSKHLFIIRFERELLDDENLSLNEGLSKEVSKEKGATFQLEDKKLLVIEMLDFLCMNSFHDLIKEFSKHRMVDFKFILVTEATLEAEENESTEEYLTKFMKVSNEDLDILPLELKFLYKSSTEPLFVHMTDNNEDKVIVRIMDLSEKKDDFNKCYDYMNRSLNELIKM